MKNYWHWITYWKMIVRRSKICYGDWFTIAKTKKIHEAILEIAVNTNSLFCPKLVDYSACVPPVLQNGFVNSFDFDDFESHKHPCIQFWSQTLLDLFPLWASLTILGVLRFGISINRCMGPTTCFLLLFDLL